MDSLQLIGLTTEALDAAGDAHAQWALVRKAYLTKAIRLHPDKGGDPDAFREIKAAFETLKVAYDAGAPLNSANVAAAANTTTPSHEWYAAAAEEHVPGYKVERAPSGRSTCVKSKAVIAKGELRIGSLDSVSGSYCRWSKVDQWRVPASVWTGVPNNEAATTEAINAALEAMNGITIVGYTALDADAKAQLCAHVVLKEHHAKLNQVSAAKASGSCVSDTTPPTTTVATVTTKSSLDLPNPGTDSVTPGQLVGKTVVLTGVFDLAGGCGFKRGKDGAKEWLESHGASVVGSVSKKTAFVVCGSKPGMDKVTKGLGVGAKLTTLKILGEGLKANDVALLVAQNPVDTDSLSYSVGFGGNGLAKRLGGPSFEEMVKKHKVH